MASLKDVAKLANVSLMTVSRALNNPERLKPETLARVQSAIEQTNYVPDLSAKKIRGARATPNTIGVLALDTVTTPFSVEIALSIEETARAHGWNSFVVNMFSDDSPETIVDLLLSHRPDGIIYTTMGLRQVPVPAKLLTLPCVLANCESLNDPVASYIPDDEQGQYAAVKALLAAGYRNPLCLHLPANHLATVRRRQGWSAPAAKPISTRIRWCTAIWPTAISTTMIFPPWCRPISVRENRRSIRLSAATIVSPLWSIRRCWRRDCGFRRTLRWWATIIWSALAICFYRRCRRCSCRTMISGA